MSDLGPMCLLVYDNKLSLHLIVVNTVQLENCHFPIGILGQVWCLIVSISDICPLPYFNMTYICILMFSFPVEIAADIGRSMQLTL